MSPGEIPPVWLALGTVVGSGSPTTAAAVYARVVSQAKISCMVAPSTRTEIIQRLAEDILVLQQQFHVRSLSVFGSAARDELTPTSDIDILVDFKEIPGYIEFMRLKFHLESLLGRSVDLATPRAIKPRIRLQIEREAVNVTRLSPVFG